MIRRDKQPEIRRTLDQYEANLHTAVNALERARVAARFTEAVELAEQAFAEELAGLVSHLVERLNARDDEGNLQYVDRRNVENLTAFFERFRTLSVRSSADLDRLVDTAQEAIAGVNPQHIRDYPTMRQTIAAQLEPVAAELDGMMVARPRRAIIRRPRPETA